MKRLKKLLVLALCACTLLIMTGVTAFAADPLEKPYTYTVTISAGNQGTFKTVPEGATLSADKTKLTFSDLEAGDTVVYDYSNGVQVSNGKYYTKCVRLSGRDNASVPADKYGVFSTTVESNADYVVGYGIEGTKINYYVTYKTADGTELQAPQEFWCNPGDKPIVAYQYFEGYRPRDAYKLTGTITKAGQSIDFVYVPSPTSTTRTITEQGQVITNIQVIPGNANVSTDANGNLINGAGNQVTDANGNPVRVDANGNLIDTNGNPVAVDANGNVVDNAAVDATAETQEGEDVTVQAVEDEETPQELIDLDEEKTPTGNIDLGENQAAASQGINKFLIGSIAVVIVAAIAICGVVVVARKKS